jgi:hypothetical protein
MALAEKTAQAGRPATGADQAQSVPESGARQSNPDSALATPPASYGDATTGKKACRKPVVGSQLDFRGGTSDGRYNKGASGQLA